MTTEIASTRGRGARAKQDALRVSRWDPETKAALTAALHIATAPPLRQAKHTQSASVPWSAVHDLRAAFERIGIDWRRVARGQ